MEKLHSDEKALQVKGGNLTEELKVRQDELKAITNSEDCSTCTTHFDSSKLEMDADYTAVSFTAFLCLCSKLTLLVHFMPNLPMPRDHLRVGVTFLYIN